ncbi:MAG: hypothetical protein FWG54_05460 [Bacteroidetes bacterium]|nr:hypothetical protein [Bacteroidota bacterium]
MLPVVIEPKTPADVRCLHDFSKQIGAKVLDPEEWFEDMVLGRIIEEGIKEQGFASMDEVFEVLRG